MVLGNAPVCRKELAAGTNRPSDLGQAITDRLHPKMREQGLGNREMESRPEDTRDAKIVHALEISRAAVCRPIPPERFPCHIRHRAATDSNRYRSNVPARDNRRSERRRAALRSRHPGENGAASVRCRRGNRTVADQSRPTSRRRPHDDCRRRHPWRSSRCCSSCYLALCCISLRRHSVLSEDFGDPPAAYAARFPRRILNYSGRRPVCQSGVHPGNRSVRLPPQMRAVRRIPLFHRPRRPVRQPIVCRRRRPVRQPSTANANPDTLIAGRKTIFAALVGYARVSTLDQDPALQRDALAAAGCKKLFEDLASGARADRPGLAHALAFLRDGDVLVVWRLDRLGRSCRTSSKPWAPSPPAGRLPLAH